MLPPADSPTEGRSSSPSQSRKAQSIDIKDKGARDIEDPFNPMFDPDHSLACLSGLGRLRQVGDPGQ